MPTKHTKYSLLLMRDDRDVKRYRVSPLWFRLALWGLLLLVACAAGGAYTGFHFWKQHDGLQREILELRHRLIESRVQLERLENVEKILQKNDTAELASLVGSATPAAPPPEPAKQFDLGDIFVRSDSHQASVENLQCRLIKNNLRISLDVNNLQNEKSLSGVISFILVARAGTQYPVEGTGSDLEFSIRRFKRIQLTLPLPNSLDGKDLFGLRVQITSPDGKTIFSDTYPLYRILS